MGISKNILDRSDISTQPIKLKYSASYASASFPIYGITVNRGTNSSFSENSASFTVYKMTQQLYYNEYITGSQLFSASYWNWSPQSTAASGTFDNDYRYFPTGSGDNITVLAMPRNVFGEKVSRNSFVINSSAFKLIDDGNGNVIDIQNNGVHVGNILYAQGVVVITNLDYEYALIDDYIGTTTTTTSTTTSTTTAPTTTTTTSTTTSTTTVVPTTTTTTSTTTSTTTPTPTTTTTSTTTEAPTTTTTTSTTTSTTTAAPTTTTTSTTTSTTTVEPTTTTTTSTTTSTTTVLGILCEDWEIINGASSNVIDYQDCLGNAQQLNLDPSEIIGCFSVNSNAFGPDIPFLGTQPFTFNKCTSTTTTTTTAAPTTTTSTTTEAPTTSTTTIAPTTTTTSTTTEAPTTTTTSTTTVAPTTTTTSTTTETPTTTTTSTTTSTTTVAPTTTTTSTTTSTTTTIPVYSYCTGYNATDCCVAESDYITNCGEIPPQ